MRFSTVAVLLSIVSMTGCQSLGLTPESRSSQVGSFDSMLLSDSSITPVAPIPEPEIRAQNAGNDQLAEPDSRIRVYSARFGVVTGDVDRSIEAFVAAVKEYGGYLETQEDSVIVCRIPAASFQTLVDRIDEFGSVGSRSIRAQDVTDAYTDFALRLNVTEAARRRLMALLEKTATLTELLKLEEELVKLTTEIELLKGQLRLLKKQVDYSTIQISFSMTPVVHGVKSSPFTWIDNLGVQKIQSGFVADYSAHKKSSLFSKKMPMKTPDGFIVVDSTKYEMQALTPEDARLWLREFSVNEDADLEFWTKALKTHFVENRGYKLLDESKVMDRLDKSQGHQLLFEAYTDRGPVHYLVTYSLRDRGFLAANKIVQVTEFAAEPKLFAEYVEAISDAAPFNVVCRPDVEIETERRLVSQND
jgi:hypothetical protein